MYYPDATNFPGPYGIEHILFLIISITVLIVGEILLYKYVRGTGKEVLVIRILGIILAVLITLNRFSTTYYSIYISGGGSWLYLIPNTFCGVTSIALSISAIIGNKNDPILHFFVYFGFFGDLSTLIYPTFLNTQMFWDFRSWTGLFHHLFTEYVIISMVVLGYFKPDFKKLWYMPFGYCAIMTFGVFEMDVLGFSKAMNINDPFVESLPVLTSWYFIFFLDFTATFLITYFFGREKVKEKCLE